MERLSGTTGRGGLQLAPIRPGMAPFAGGPDAFDAATGRFRGNARSRETPEQVRLPETDTCPERVPSALLPPGPRFGPFSSLAQHSREINWLGATGKRCHSAVFPSVRREPAGEKWDPRARESPIEERTQLRYSARPVSPQRSQQRSPGGLHSRRIPSASAMPLRCTTRLIILASSLPGSRRK